MSARSLDTLNVTGRKIRRCTKMCKVCQEPVEPETLRKLKVRQGGKELTPLVKVTDIEYCDLKENNEVVIYVMIGRKPCRILVDTGAMCLLV